MRPGKPGFRIKHIWAFIALDPRDDTEGTPAVLGPNGTWMSAIAADEDRLRDMREMVKDIVRKTGVRVRLVRFDVMVELGEVTGDAPG